jgi:hypothetical protein
MDALDAGRALNRSGDSSFLFQLVRLLPSAAPPCLHSGSQTRRSTDDVVLSGDEACASGVAPPVSVSVVSEVGVTVGTVNRLAIPGGGVPPESSFLAMPGGRARSRFASPGGTIFDLPGEAGCVEVTGPVLEMCICNPPSGAIVCRRWLATP